MAVHLSSHHRRTVEEIFAQPTSANIEWREVRSLLAAVGEVEEEHNGKLKVALRPETEVIHPPRGKDIDKGLVIDLAADAGRGRPGPRRNPRNRRSAGPRPRRLALGQADRLAI